MEALPVVDPWDEKASRRTPRPRRPSSGSPATTPPFFRQELRPLVALAAAIAGADRAEEIAQEALLRAHREWDRIGRYDKPGAWVRRVTINLATSNRRRRRSESTSPCNGRARAAARRPPARRSTSSGPLVRALPRRQAAAVALHYLDDLSIAEIADALGCAEGTAKAHLHNAPPRARRPLRPAAGARPEPFR